MSAKFYRNSKELAEYLGIDEGTLRKWRWAGQGPAYVKLGRRVAYPDDKTQQWLAENRVEPSKMAS